MTSVLAAMDFALVLEVYWFLLLGRFRAEDRFLDITDELEVECKCFEPGSESHPHRMRVGVQILLFDHLDRGERCRETHWVTACA